MSLFIPCQNSHLNIVKVLLQSENIQVNQLRDIETTPLFIACQQGHLTIVKVLQIDKKKTIYCINKVNSPQNTKIENDISHYTIMILLFQFLFYRFIYLFYYFHYFIYKVIQWPTLNRPWKKNDNMQYTIHCFDINGSRI